MVIHHVRRRRCDRVTPVSTAVGVATQRLIDERTCPPLLLPQAHTFPLESTTYDVDPPATTWEMV